jgi:hypothetical protein
MQAVLGRLVIIVAAAGIIAAPALADNKKLPPANARVLKFVEERIDRKVADGDCWQLADAALSAARARRPGRNGYGVYDFGRLVKDDASILPGDIVQFSGTSFASRNGARYSMSRHTAIISKVDGNKVELLHQNWNGVRHVTRLEIDLSDLRAGTIAVFRPQPAIR